MAGNNTTEDWDEFVDVVTQVIVGHQEVSFIETVALALKDGVYDEYKNWKWTPDGMTANVAKKVKYVLDTWKSAQTQRDFDYLLCTFDSKLLKERFANELRTKVADHFRNRPRSSGTSSSNTTAANSHQSTPSVPQTYQPSSNVPTFQIHGNATIQNVGGNFDNRNGVGQVSGNNNQVTSGNQEKTNKKKDLSEVMNEAGLSDLYGKFQGKGVTVDVIWELPEDLLSFLELNPMEKFRYEKAKKKYADNL